MNRIRLQHIRFIAIIVTLAVSTNLHSQFYGVAVNLGGGSYKMSDLKYYQESLLDRFPVEGKMISLFPPYFTGGVTFFRTMNDYFKIGLDYNFSSTGAKASYIDYSGEREASMVIRAHQIGVTLDYRLLGGNKFELLANGSLSAAFSSLEISELVSASSQYFGSYSNGYVAKYKSTSPMLSVGLEGLYHADRYSFGIDAGYYHDFTNDLIYADDSRYSLNDPNDPDRILTADWSGFRAHIKMIILLNNL